MKAGPKMDAEIAEKVMGWIKHGEIGEVPNGKEWQEDNGGWNQQPPEYSTDISAAMQVWNKLRNSGAWCCLKIDSDYNYVYDITLIRSGLKDIMKGKPEPKHRPTIHVAGPNDESLAYLICLTALKAAKLLEEEDD